MALSDQETDRILYLVRHGKAASNGSGVFAGWNHDPLLPAGRLQAEEAASILALNRVEAVFSSPVTRARETAVIIAERLGVNPVCVDDLGDLKVPQWEGRAKSGLLADSESGYPTWKESPHLFNIDGSAGNAETLRELQERSVAAVEAIFDSEPYRKCAVVTHLANIRCIVLHYSRRPLSDYRKITIKNAAPLALVKKDDHIVIAL